MSGPSASLVAIILHTPTWVWVLYAALLFVGFQRTRDSILPLWRLSILPVAVTILTITTAIGSGAGVVPVLLLALALGAPAGWRLEPRGGAHRLPGGRVALRGEWWTLVQIVVVLSFRYVINVAAHLDPSLGANSTWQTATLFASTALSAIFLGRFAARLWMYVEFRKAPRGAAARPQ
jgi:hypothetical protein